MDGPETASAVDTVLSEVVTTRLPLMEQDENQYHSVSQPTGKIFKERK